MVVLGILGKKRSGKDTLANYIAEMAENDGKRVNIVRFAQPLKTLVQTGLKLPISLDDESIKNDYDTLVGQDRLQALTRHILVYTADNNLPPLTEEEIVTILNLGGRPLGEVYRFLLQYVGTDIFRKRMDLFWVKRMEDLLDACRDFDLVIVPDVRFMNEAALIKSYQNSFLVKISRCFLQDQDTHASEVAVEQVPSYLIDSFLAISEGLEHVHNAAQETYDTIKSMMID